MKCKYKYLLPDLLQNKLSQSDFNIITEHLKSCDECRNEHRQLDELFNIMKVEKQPGPNNSYWIYLPTKIKNKIESKKVNPLIRYIPQLALSTSVIIIFSIFIFQLLDFLSTDKNINTTTELVSIIDSVDQSDLLDYVVSTIDSSNELDVNNVDEFVLKNIILTSNGIDEYYLENVNVHSLKDEEIKYLLSYLNQKNY